MKEKIDKIFLFIICTVIIISSIFVGTPVTHNYLILSVILNAFAFIYLCINCGIKPRKNWIDNILSVAVLLLTISSCIPIIFRKCASLSDSMQSVLIYISLFSVFAMLKEIQVKNKKKYIAYSIIISACILCLIGFDDLTLQVFKKILKQLGNANFTNQDHRMFANFGYANAFALYIAVAFALTLNEYKKEEKLAFKLIDIVLLIIFIISILLSYSRGTWICLILYVIINFILEKNKKYVIIGATIVITLITVIIIILLNYTKPLVLFNTLDEKSEYIQNINYVSDEDGYYDVEIDLDANSSLKNDFAYEIVISERNKYNDIEEEHSILVNNEKETKKIEFKKQDDTKYLTITYKSLYKSERRGLTINSVMINGKNIVVNYKYLPTKIVEKIKNTNANNISTWERFVFLKDGIKIIEKNAIIGFGGNAWEYMQYQVQDYRYTAKEVHSYPIEIWMEFGIIGFISLILIAFYVIKSIKNSNNRKFSIIILMILLHSLLDFGMSFYIIQLAFFVLLACISEPKYKNAQIWSNYIILVIIFVGLIGNSLYFISNTIYEKSVYRKENKTEQAEKCVKIYPFNAEARQYIISNDEQKLQKENVLWWVKNEPYKESNWLIYILEKSVEHKKTLTDEARNDYFNIIYNNVTNPKLETPFNVENEMERYRILNDLTKCINGEQKEQLKKLLNAEKDKIILHIQNKNSRLKKEDKEYYLERLNEE